MAANLASMRAMFQWLEMSPAVDTVLVDTKGIFLLDLLASLTVIRCKSLVYTIHRPGGVAQGHDVTMKAYHNLSVCSLKRITSSRRKWRLATIG